MPGAGEGRVAEGALGVVPLGQCRPTSGRTPSIIGDSRHHIAHTSASLCQASLRWGFSVGAGCLGASPVPMGVLQAPRSASVRDVPLALDRGAFPPACRIVICTGRPGRPRGRFTRAATVDMVTLTKDSRLTPLAPVIAIAVAAAGCSAVQQQPESAGACAMEAAYASDLATVAIFNREFALGDVAETWTAAARAAVALEWCLDAEERERVEATPR